jgi:hypothetical protein
MRKIGAAAAAMLLFTGLGYVLAGETVELGGLTSKTPAGWKMQEPSNKLRKFQFLVPKVDGDKEDSELVVFFFGAAGGGSADDNIKRWKGQFIAPEGKTIEEVSKIEKFKVGKGGDVVYLDIQGTYKYKNPPFSPTAKEERKPDFRRFGVIFDTDKGPYFITLTGPAKTIGKNKEAFDGWIKAFK